MFLFTVLVIVVSLQGLYLGWLGWRSPKAAPENLILLFVLYANFAWALVPAYVSILIGETDLFNFGYPISTWSLGLFLEFVFFTCFIVVFRRKRNVALADKLASRFNATPSPVRFVWVVLFLSLGLYLLLYGPWTRVGFEGAGKYLTADLATEDITIGGLQDTIYSGVLLPALCVLLFYVPREQISRFARYAIGVALAFATVDAIASGVRGKVLQIFFSVAACLLASGQRKKALGYFVVVIALLAVLSAAFVQFKEVGAFEYAGESAWTKVNRIVSLWREGPSSAQAGLWVTTYLIRLDSVQDGGILATETSKSGRFAYVQPFVGSLVAPVPRYIWHDKPLALSRDDSVAGLPWYVVMDYRDQPWNNGSVSTSGIAYWQFGWMGVLITAIVGAIVVRSLSRIAFSGGILGILFFLCFSMMVHFRMPVGIDETILVLLQVIAPLLVLHALYLWFVNRPAAQDPSLLPATSPHKGLRQ